MAEEASRELLKIPTIRHYPGSIESGIVVWDLALFLLTLFSSVCISIRIENHWTGRSIPVMLTFKVYELVCVSREGTFW